MTCSVSCITGIITPNFVRAWLQLIAFVVLEMYRESRNSKTKAESGETRGVISKLSTTIMRPSEWSM